MDKNALIEQYKNSEVIKTAFTGEQILYEFVHTDNILYYVIKNPDGSFDVVAASTLSVARSTPLGRRLS